MVIPVYTPPTYPPEHPCHHCEVAQAEHGIMAAGIEVGPHNWSPADLRTRTIVPPRAVPELPGFEEHYGVRFVPPDEDNDSYLVIGHARSPRNTVAACTRWARVGFGQRYRDWRWLDFSYQWAVFTVPQEDPSDWHVDYVEAGASGSIAVTLVTGLEHLEDPMPPSRCPMCHRMRATGREFHDGSPWYPGKATAWVHECPCTGGPIGFTWPAEHRTTTTA